MLYGKPLNDCTLPEILSIIGISIVAILGAIAAIALICFAAWAIQPQHRNARFDYPNLFVSAISAERYVVSRLMLHT